MNIEARRIEIVQEFLKVQNEEVMSKFEKLLKMEKKSTKDFIDNSMTREKLDARIDKLDKS